MGPEISTSNGTIRIVSLAPTGPYIDGISYDFSVQVAYTLTYSDDAQIFVGFGYCEPDGFVGFNISVEDIVSPTASEVIKTYTFSESLYDADPNEELIVVFLTPPPVDGSYTPHDSEFQVITVTTP